MNELQTMVINAGLKGEGVDKWEWTEDPTKSYSARSAYRWMGSNVNSTVDPFFNHLWRGVAPLKVKGFVWKLAQDRIPTSVNLACRNVPLESVICKGCEKEEETTDHLFFRCAKFASAWYSVLKWWKLSGPMQGGCKDHFLQFSGLIIGNKKQRKMWTTIWFAVIWVIWSTRNNVIFSGKVVEVSELIEMIKLKTWLWISAKDANFKYPFVCWSSNPSDCVGLLNG